MAIDVGASAIATSIAASQATSPISTQPSGSSFLIYLIYSGATFTSIVDNKGNTYSQVGAEFDVGANSQGRLYLKENGVGGSGHTATLTQSSSDYLLLALIEITGGKLSGLVDQQAGQNDTSSPFTSPPITPTEAQELLLGFMGDASTNVSNHTHGNSFTSVVAANDGTFWVASVSKRLVSSIAAYNTSVTISGNGTANHNMIVSLKQASGGLLGASCL